jgi:hypothetical protein
MKFQFLVILTLVWFVNTNAQTTHIVDNNSNGIGSFTTLSAAISAATAGDVIILVPSPTSYGDLSLTSTGKRLTIAGGGFNGSIGMVTKLGAISLNGGNADNTNLDNFVLGGFECESIDVKFVDGIKIKALKTRSVINATNYDLRVVNSTGAEIEYITTGNTLFTSNNDMKIFHSVFIEKVNTTVVEIQTSKRLLFSNSFIGHGIDNTTNHLLLISEGSSGNFNNNVIYKSSGAWKTVDFGDSVNVTNNIIYEPTYYYLEIKNGLKYLNNSFYVGYGNNPAYFVIPDGILDVDGNKFETPQIPPITYAKYVSGLDLKPIDGSPVIDSGFGKDVDGTVADRGVYGGLDPMPAVLPNFAIGVSVVPSITDMSVSLPTAVSGGKMMLKVSGNSKKN